jgi:hypothetical protein
LQSSPHELFNPQWFEDWQKRKNGIQEIKQREQTERVRNLESKIFGDTTNVEIKKLEPAPQEYDYTHTLPWSSDKKQKKEEISHL